MRITREIGIDMAHRVPDHGSKCRNLHGHRYHIVTTLEGDLAESGEETGMVMDFGFMKDVLMREIDTPCDHGTCLFVRDAIAVHVLGPLIDRVLTDIKVQGYASACTNAFGKLYLVPFVPTAENLARHWYQRMHGVIDTLTAGRAYLYGVRVWETPNCWAEYTIQSR